ncbi:MAG: dehydrogenase E1 component subunit alpha/beta [Rhodothermales bacterium]|nr:dehydrogenase E1 component subunit alpha/beta [Rhodothermales bacterium]
MPAPAAPKAPVRPKRPASSKTALPKTVGADELPGLLDALLLPRAVEERMLKLIRQGRVSKWFSGLGQEAIAVGCAWALEPQDYLLPMHRNLGVWTTRGLPLRRLLCQLMGRTGGYTKGRDRTFHFGLPEKRIVGMISHLGAMWPVACGLGLASTLKAASPADSGEPFVACALLGEGATREGDFHEALSLAAIWKLPVIFVVENNGYGLSTPTREAVPVENIADAASGYGIAGEIVDGNDVLAVVDAVRRARKHALAGDGPTLLEMKTFRMRGHEEASGTKYVPQALFDEWGPKDPVTRFLKLCLDRKLVTDDEVAEKRKALDEAVYQDTEYALAQPEVSSTAEAEAADVFAPSPDISEPSDVGSTTDKRFLDGVTDALREAMDADARVVLMGQDIAGYGGVFKITEGFLDRFGADRVRNTPIMESGVLGAAMGLALEGFRPVVEMQYADFITCGFNQIVNNLGTTHYRWGAPLNVTIRAPFGGTIGAGPFHSQAMEAWFVHAPGLKVVVPATPADAKGLLLAAMDDPNPVLVFEHKALYRGLKGPIPDASHRVPLGKARIAREGRDLTLVTYGIGVLWAEEEAAHWAAQGREIEIVDLRTLKPWDRETCLASVAKTNRLVVLHEAWRTGGVGAEVTAELCEAAFEHLDAPPVRLGALDTPIAFSKDIEMPVFSAKARLRDAVARTLAF